MIATMARPDVITPVAVGHHHHWIFVDNVNTLTVRARASKNGGDGDERKRKKIKRQMVDQRLLKKKQTLENVAPPLTKENKLALGTSIPHVLSHSWDMVFRLFGPKGIGLCSSFNHGFNLVQIFTCFLVIYILVVR